MSGNISEQEPVELTLRPRRTIRRIFVVCVLIEITLFLLDYHVNYGRLIDVVPIRNLVNMTREDALASWIGVTQTLLVALTLWLVFAVTRRQGRSRLVQLGWLLVALFFSYMALDDGSELHERMGSTFRVLQENAADADDAAETGGRILDIYPSYAWQALLLPFFGAMGLFVFVFLWGELGDWKSRLLVGAAISCFVLAIGLDFVEGLDEDHPLNLYTILDDRFDIESFTMERFDREAYTALRHFSKSIEETLEMLGMTLFWVAFLGHLFRTAPDLRFRFGDRSATV